MLASPGGGAEVHGIEDDFGHRTAPTRRDLSWCRIAHCSTPVQSCAFVSHQTHGRGRWCRSERLWTRCGSGVCAWFWTCANSVLVKKPRLITRRRPTTRAMRALLAQLTIGRSLSRPLPCSWGRSTGAALSRRRGSTRRRRRERGAQNESVPGQQ